MSDYRIAYRYAKSLIELAEERGELDDVNSDMVLINQVCSQNRDLVLMLKNPVISGNKKLTVLKEIFRDKVQQLTLSLFEIIVRKNRERFLPELSKAFHEMYNEKKGVVMAKIITGFKLDDKLRNQFLDKIRKITGSKKVELEEELNKDLIGGFILKVGDKQIDDSINTKLRSLRFNLQS